ncbi:transmembrane protein, putative [Bodo saltans]|uniref:Transmembrane protein, putative n=1 Tax=Bodo saltans TaxID=75058 RepID=A0A0S4JAF3_BODSA|nr:transmembrane protein, putative [Bodo saltans]|eukprot:CUG85936.1 transmembrane protein, putative [Bodo saltans]
MILVSVFRLLNHVTVVSTFTLVLKDVHVRSPGSKTSRTEGSVSNCSLIAEAITYLLAGAGNSAVAITGVFFFFRLPMIEGTIVSAENVTLQGAVNPTPQVAAIYLGAESSCRSCRIQIGNIRFLQISALSFALLVDNSSIEHFFNCHHC